MLVTMVINEYNKNIQEIFRLVILLLLFIIQFAVVAHGCHDHERNALLSFKSLLRDPVHRLSSWQVGSNGNCCDWHGVQCSSSTFHVLSIDLRNTNQETYFKDDSSSRRNYDFPRERYALFGTISPSLFELTHLEYLDLSFNFFNYSQIPNQFSYLKKLTHLDLSNSMFQGSVTTQFANLSSLQYLDISCNLEPMDYDDYPSIGLSFLNSLSTNWVRGLVSLKVLKLGGVDLYKATNWAKPISSLSNLIELDISRCNLDTPFPTNEFLNLTRLSSLKMKFNYLFIPFPHQLSNISSLSSLDLSGCQLQGPLPYLPQVEHLRVNENPDLQVNLSSFIATAPLTVSLFASSCSIQGSLPTAISSLSKLQYLDLSNNKITGVIPESICGILSLRRVSLANNNISGKFPRCITKLRNLSHLDFSRNNIFGKISLTLLINGVNLTRLNLNSNRLTVELDQYPLLATKFPLERLQLKSCNLQGYFPNFICKCTKLNMLDFSNNNLSGVVPSCLFKATKSLTYVDLSRNNLAGPLPFPPQNVYQFDLSYNRFSGEISVAAGERLAKANYISLSHNQLSGSIPFSICSEDKEQLLLGLMAVDFSNNHLSGDIPSSLGNCSYLTFLNLGMNSFTGNVPKSLEQARTLHYIHFNDNNLTGTFPSLTLSGLQILNLANNNFQGTIPTLVAPIRFLSLRSNKFNGSIPQELLHLPELQVLDLSKNNLSGRLPGKMRNLTTLIHRPKETHMYSEEFYTGTLELRLVIKGTMMHLEKLYNYNSGIDLSCNSLEGNIPEEIGLLKGLAMLNISHNRFSGNIPTSVGNMTGLGSLDVSFNKLSGPIPQSLTSLDSLGYFNVSYNNLSGGIPRGHHFDTLSVDGSAFFGNELLCGIPTKKSCEADKKTPKDTQPEKHPRERLLFYSVVTLGFTVGFGGLFFVLFLKKEKWWFEYWRIVDIVAVRIASCIYKI